MLTEAVAAKIEQLEKNVVSAESNMWELEYARSDAEREYSRACARSETARDQYEELYAELSLWREAVGKDTTE